MATTNRYRASGLAEFIAEQGRQIDWVARQGGVHASFVTHVLAGRRTIGEEAATRIANALGVPLFLAFELTSGSESLPERSESERVPV